MKHTVRVTALLLMLFVLSQAVGLFLINTDLVVNTVVIDNVTVSVANYSETAVGERPILNEWQTFLYIGFAVLIGTIIVLLLIKFKKPNIWKGWFFLAVGLTITISLGVLVNKWVAYGIGFALAAWKIFRPNVWVHNLTEVLMYSGIAIIFVPLLNIFWALMLLFAISVYDMYAVWKSKHMIDMAQFQSKSGVFAGLNISYNVPKEKSMINKKIDVKEIKSMPKLSSNKLVSDDKRQAILGGGDIAFPMIFAGVVMQWLIIDMAVSKPLAYLEANIITLFVALALGLLFYYAKKDKFYPAMPFVTAGALLAYGIILVINLL